MFQYPAIWVEQTEKKMLTMQNIVAAAIFLDFHTSVFFSLFNPRDSKFPIQGVLDKIIPVVSFVFRSDSFFRNNGLFIFYVSIFVR